MNKLLLVLTIAYGLLGINGYVYAQANAAFTLEILLNTDGDLRFTKETGNSKATVNKGRSTQNDTLVKVFESTSEVKVYTTSQKNKENRKEKHDVLTIGIPDLSQVSISTKIGNINISEVYASISGSMEGGKLTVDNMDGAIEMVNELGDIEINNSTANGVVIARNGNLNLKNVSGAMASIAPQGKITLNIDSDFYKKEQKKQPLLVRLAEGDINIKDASNGGTVELGKGNLTVNDVKAPLVINCEQSQINLTGVESIVSLKNKGNVLVRLNNFKLTGDDKDSPPSTYEIENGDFTIEISLTFNGIFELWVTEVNPSGNNLPILTNLTPSLLGKVSVIDNANLDNTFNIRETSYVATLGKGGPRITIHVTNGKLNVKTY